MRAVVTGGAGFLGSHLVDALIAEGSSVVVIDDLSTGHLGNLERAIASGAATFVFADVAGDLGTLRTSMGRAAEEPVDRFFHLASPASPEAYGSHPWETLAANATGTMNMIELALDQRATFLFASTSEVYGDPLVHPQTETYVGNVDPIGPRSCYDEGKRFGEAAVAAAVRARRLDGKIVRYFNCYGPRMQAGDGRLVPALIEAAIQKVPFPIHGTGDQTRSLTYVRDAVAATLRVVSDPKTLLWPVNIGNDDERSVEDIARTVARIMDCPYEPVHLTARPQDPQRRRPNLERLRSLGWTPTTELEDGLRETIAWFRTDRLAFA